MKPRTLELIDQMLARESALQDARASLTEAVERLCRCFADGHSLYVCGNGGSASDAEHIVGELVKAFRKKRPISETERARFAALYPDDGALLEHLQVGFPAYSLVSGTAIMTAIVNDLGGEYIYAQQANAYLQSGDILWGISTSGNSAPIIHAMKVARLKGAQTIAMTGKSGGQMSSLADLTLRSTEQETYLVQQEHIAFYHIICAAVEEELA